MRIGTTLIAQPFGRDFICGEEEKKEKKADVNYMIYNEIQNYATGNLNPYSELFTNQSAF
jgi:hypothetical protein